MSSQRHEMNVESRTIGKHHSRKLRRDRKVPAVVYGSTDNKNVTVDEGFILKYNVRAYENALFNLKSTEKGLNNIVALIKEVKVHPVTRRPQHVDLFALDLKKVVRVSIEIKFEGKPQGLAEGGLLTIVNRQIEIECLPTEIPEGISAQISHLGVGDALHVSDIELPASVKLISNSDMTLAVVNLAEEESASVATTEAPAAGAAAPAAGAPAAAKAGDAKAAPAKADAKAPAAKAPAAKAPAKK